jgi:hypothetical protein
MDCNLTRVTHLYIYGVCKFRGGGGGAVEPKGTNTSMCILVTPTCLDCACAWLAHALMHPASQRHLLILSTLKMIPWEASAMNSLNVAEQYTQTTAHLASSTGLNPHRLAWCILYKSKHSTCSCSWLSAFSLCMLVQS